MRRTGRRQFLRVPLMRMQEPALTGRDTAERLQTWFAPFTWYERRSLRTGYRSHRSLGQYERCQGDHLRRMLYVDCHTWLADNLLERGDRMSMAASIEGIENRPPFLDHELVELAFRIDSSLKVKGQSGKWIVKEIARLHLPANGQHRRPQEGGLPRAARRMVPRRAEGPRARPAARPRCVRQPVSAALGGRGDAG
jgi:asparagine synthetase B (glutamine-hydrolysing)